MFDQLKQRIGNGISIEVGEKNRFDQHKVMVKDVAQGSITSGWYLTYLPKMYTNGTERLYDGKEAFSTLSIANFQSVFTAIMGADYRFKSGESVIRGNDGRMRATYESGGARFMVVDYENTTSVTLTITQEASPFQMLSVNFRVVDSEKDGRRHLIGSENHWDMNTDIFTEHNASMSPKKKRVLQVHQESSTSLPYVKAISQQGHMQGTTELDPNNSAFEWMQDMKNKYKALAYIHEQTIIEVAMERALDAIKGKPEQTSFSFGSLPPSAPPIFNPPGAAPAANNHIQWNSTVFN